MSNPEKIIDPKNLEIISSDVHRKEPNIIFETPSTQALSLNLKKVEKKTSTSIPSKVHDYYPSNDKRVTSKDQIKKKIKESRDEFFDAKDYLLIVDKTNENIAEEFLAIPSPSNKTGNNLKNPNLSNFKLIEEPKTKLFTNQMISESLPKIKFDIGKSVRPQLHSSKIHSRCLFEKELGSVEFGSRKDLDTSTFDECESLKRRISFVSRPDIFSEDCLPGTNSFDLEKNSSNDLCELSEHNSKFSTGGNCVLTPTDLIMKQVCIYY